MDDEADNSSFAALQQRSDNSSLDYLENLDTSEYPFPNTLWHIKPTTEIAIKSSVMVTIAVFGIVLNSIILIIITRNRWLWTVSNYLVGNMALVDLLTLIFCPWFWLVRDFYQKYVLGNFGCRFEGFLQGTFLLAGVGAVILVSYDRLAAAALTAEAKITKNAAPKLMSLTWIIAVGLSLPWIFKREYFERLWLDYLETFCVEDVTFLSVYWHIIITILVWVPLGLMFITYGAIMWRLERSAKMLKSHGGQTIGRARGKAVRITACVLVAAMLCRLPYTVMVYWRNNLRAGINALSKEKIQEDEEDKNTKIFVVESTPKQHKRIGYLIKNMLHIQKDSLELSIPKCEECKATRITPLNI